MRPRGQAITARAPIIRRVATTSAGITELPQPCMWRRVVTDTTKNGTITVPLRHATVNIGIIITMRAGTTATTTDLTC